MDIYHCETKLFLKGKLSSATTCPSFHYQFRFAYLSIVSGCFIPRCKANCTPSGQKTNADGKTSLFYQFTDYYLPSAEAQLQYYIFHPELLMHVYYFDQENTVYKFIKTD